MNLKEILYNELSGNALLKSELEEVIEKEITKTYSTTINEERKPIVTKETVLDYLKTNGMVLSQDNFDYVQRYLENKAQDCNQNGEIELKSRERVCINHLNEFSEDEMKTLLDICILRKLSEIEKRVTCVQEYEYIVHSFEDVGGTTTISKLSDVINGYAERGFRIKDVVVNEIGKNAVAIGGVGINSTVNELIVIFERPKMQ